MPDAFGQLTAQDFAANPFMASSLPAVTTPQVPTSTGTTDLSSLASLMGNATMWSPQQAQFQQTAQYQNAQQAATQAYQQGMLQYQNDALAFQKAQAAFTDAMSMGTAYGYSPGGNWQQMGGATQPPAGTPTMAAITQQQTLANQQLQNAIAMSGVTGTFAQPMPSQYTPGTVLTAPSTTPGLGNAYGIVNADGSVQMVSSQALAQTAAQRGTTAQALIQAAQPVDWTTLQSLSQGPPTGAQQQTLQAQAQQFTQAQNAAGLTGYFSDPTQTLQAYNSRGQALNGQQFNQLPADQQQYWLQYSQNDPTKAAQMWATDTNSAQVQAGAQIQGQNTPTLALQAMYGQAGAPQQGQYTLQALQQQQQAAQSYLSLLSQLQGPADYGQYLKVLGATPGGMQDLVGAAAGRYVPGTGVSGQAPQAQTLQNLVGAASGGAGGGTGSNAATQSPGTQTYGMQQPGGGTQQVTGAASPGGMNYQDYLATAQGLPAPSQIAPQSFNAMTSSQKQMLGGMYSNLGWSPQDVNNLYQQSLPKYAAGSAAGNFRLQ